MARPGRPALVISTYNSHEPLRFCLESLAHQTHGDFEIFIADDGSDSQTRQVIESYRSRFRHPIHHHWHEDQGYRKAQINNRVFREIGEFPFVIFIDGDVLCHHQFVEDHFGQHQASPGPLLFMGRRVELGPKITSHLRLDQISSFCRGLSLRLVWSDLTRDTRNGFRAIRIDWSPLEKILKRDRVKDLLGSNFSVSTQSLLEVNGYDESFASYWGEDGDLFIRLRNLGIAISGSKSLAIQYHMHHQRRDPDPAHVLRYEKMLSNRELIRCQNGIVKG